MRPRPLPAWLIVLGVAGVLAVGGMAVVQGGGQRLRGHGHGRGGSAGAPIGPVSLFDPLILVDVPAAGPGAGTAFSIDEQGLWLTARHVVDRCGSVAIVVSPGKGVAARIRMTDSGETAVLATQGGAPPLPLAPDRVLRRGALAFHPGFPQGVAGAAASRLLRRETLIEHGHRFGLEPVLAWSEIAHTPGLGRNLQGLSGAPALDPRGRVIGVTIAQSASRRRLYTTTPQAVRAALRRARIAAPLAVGRARAIGLASYGRVAAALRARLSVARVVCLAR